MNEITYIIDLCYISSSKGAYWLTDVDLIRIIVMYVCSITYIFLNLDKIFLDKDYDIQRHTGSWTWGNFNCLYIDLSATPEKQVDEQGFPILGGFLVHLCDR